MNKYPLLFLCVFFFLNSCASFNSENWPEELPAKQIFTEAYRSDAENQSYHTEDEYLFWIDRFYNGFNLVPGWLGITSGILERVESSQRENIESQMESLGQRIGKEWARNNTIRLINTRSASVWRDALLESLNQGELHDYLDILNQDVDDILSGQLDNDEIYFERYYIDEFDF